MVGCYVYGCWDGAVSQFRSGHFCDPLLEGRVIQHELSNALCKKMRQYCFLYSIKGDCGVV